MGAEVSMPSPRHCWRGGLGFSLGPRAFLALAEMSCNGERALGSKGACVPVISPEILLDSLGLLGKSQPGGAVCCPRRRRRGWPDGVAVRAEAGPFDTRVTKLEDQVLALVGSGRKSDSLMSWPAQLGLDRQENGAERAPEGAVPYKPA